MEHVIELRSVERSFVTEPDFADRVASMFGAKSNARTLRAVDGVDLTIGPGEVVGLVGESGCGKSTLGRIVAGILPQDKGDVLFDGRALADKTRLKDGSGLGVQMIFQNPASALDPRQRIGDAIAEAPVAHRLIHRSEARLFALNALQRVGLGEDARTGSLMNFRGVSGKESVSLERWQSIHASLFAMKPSRHWMSQSRPRSSTCFSTSSKS